MSPRRGLVRGTLTYLRRDLREIVAPTSLPDEDDADGNNNKGVGGIGGDASSGRSSNRLAGRLRAVTSGVRAYCDSWGKAPLEAAEAEEERRQAAHEDEEDAALREAADDARDALASASRQAASAAASAAAAAAAASATGSEALRPALRHLYRTRAAAYRDAVFSFVEGYREGVAGVAAKEEEEDEGKEKEKREKARRSSKEATATPTPTPTPTTATPKK
jgi:hypothetical protein